MKKRERQTQQMGVRLTRRLKALVRKEAAERKWTPSQIVRDSLEQRYGLGDYAGQITEAAS